MYKAASADLCQTFSNKIKELLSKCQVEAFIRPVGIKT